MMYWFAKFAVALCLLMVSTPVWGDISFSWDNPSPTFVRPLGPWSSSYGYLAGTVDVDPGTVLSHYTFYLATKPDGTSLTVAFAPEFFAFASSIVSGSGGIYHGNVLRFDVYHNSELGLYDQTGTVSEPIPFLQFHDYNQFPVVHSEKAYYSYRVSAVPEPCASLFFWTITVGNGLLNWRRRSRQ